MKFEFFSLLCLNSIGMVYKHIAWFLTNCVFQGRDYQIKILLFHNRCCCHGDKFTNSVFDIDTKFIDGVNFKGDKFTTNVNNTSGTVIASVNNKGKKPLCHL